MDPLIKPDIDPELRFAEEELHNRLDLATLLARLEMAESAQKRSAFLAEASALLASSLDYEATLSSLARLTVPFVADYCILYELQEGGEIHQVALAHVDPEKERLLELLGRLYRPHLDNAASPVVGVIRTGTPRYSAEPTPETAYAVTEDLQIRAIYEQLRPRSWMVLPLSIRGQTFGALFLATSDSGRRFGETEMQLGRELATRAAVAMDNSRLYREARRANAAKDQFLAALSHELRTPLAPVLAVISSLESDEKLRREIGRELSMVRRNVELEARLIDDLLDLTRIARGKLELHCQGADLRQIAAHALQSCDAQEVQRKRLCFVIDLDASDHVVWGDPPRLTQVFWNLLRNAVKFTPEGGTIRVHSRREEGEVVIEVADTGIGIAPDVLPRIFNAFEQADPAITRRFGGLGLGLAISKAIVEMHGGRLEAVSPGSGQGATFTLRLPLAPNLPSLQQTKAEEPRRDVVATGSLRILLVEDHADTAEAMAELLSILGHQVTVAKDVATGRAAAEGALTGPGLDLVISDIGLPDGTGFDLMRELSSRHGLRGIALSGYGTEDDLRKSREAGFLRHLTKPIDLGRLREVLRDLSLPSSSIPPAL
jgi:signal transduction histidine kinase/ActR/RegA family two-component response regulator